MKAIILMVVLMGCGDIPPFPEDFNMDTEEDATEEDESDKDSEEDTGFNDTEDTDDLEDTAFETESETEFETESDTPQIDPCPEEAVCVENTQICTDVIVGTVIEGSCYHVLYTCCADSLHCPTDSKCIPTVACGIENGTVDTDYRCLGFDEYCCTLN